MGTQLLDGFAVRSADFCLSSNPNWESNRIQVQADA